MLARLILGKIISELLDSVTGNHNFRRAQMILRCVRIHMFVQIQSVAAAFGHHVQVPAFPEPYRSPCGNCQSRPSPPHRISRMEVSDCNPVERPTGRGNEKHSFQAKGEKPAKASVIVTRFVMDIERSGLCPEFNIQRV